MKKHTSKITTKSIEQSGLPNDYKKAVSEYIWNSFDAGATRVNLTYQGNELGRLESFSIGDNGKGIDMSKIDESFGKFLDSDKRDPVNQENFQKGRKGKGRFAFSIFANQCSWRTSYSEPSGKTLSYQIQINKSDLQHFFTGENTIEKGAKPGTIVNFYDFFELSANSLASKEFENYLSGEFGWFLFLNKGRNLTISINGADLPYQDRIADSHEELLDIGDDRFKVVFLRWDQKIGDKYFFYFLNQKQKEQTKRHTSFNNKAIEFHHSLYITSAFFDSFHETKDDHPVFEQFENNQQHPTFRNLLKALNSIVSKKEKDYIRDVQADNLIHDYHSKGVFPDTNSRAGELEESVKEIYCAEPKIFQSSNLQQSKMIVGLLNIILATGNSEHIVPLIQNITALTEEEIENLVQVHVDR